MKTELEGRTLEFALRAIVFVDRLPQTTAGSVIGRQLLKASTSIGANYREANRAESKDDFVHKVALALKEAAETEYWLLLHARAFIGNAADLATLSTEAGELIAILSTIKHRAD